MHPRYTLERAIIIDYAMGLAHAPLTLSERSWLAVRFVTLRVHLELRGTVKYRILTEPRAPCYVYKCKWSNAGVCAKPFT